jgi:hypothetical protein
MPMHSAVVELWRIAHIQEFIHICTLLFITYFQSNSLATFTVILNLIYSNYQSVEDIQTKRYGKSLGSLIENVPIESRI